MNNIPAILVEKLRHPLPKERSAAVFELERMDDPDKLPVLINALRVESDLLVGEDLTFAIMRMGNLAVSPVIELLRDDDPKVRHHAAHILGKIGDTDATDALINALQDENAVVVMKTAFALGQIGDVLAVPALVGLLEHENREVQTTLLHVLEGFGETVVPLLVDALKHDQWQVRSRAVDILGAIGISEVIPALIQALSDEHWQVRLSAVTALGALEGHDAQNALQQMLADPDVRVSALASTVGNSRAAGRNRLRRQRQTASAQPSETQIII